jgi:hypothetical protein
VHDGFFLFPFFSMAGFGLLGLIWLVLWIWALISTIRSGESDGAIVAWILVLIFIPLLGLIIWLFAGPRSKRT